MGIYELLFWYILAFIAGWLFGTTFVKPDYKHNENNMQELSFCEECEGCAKFEPLNKPNVYITDLLLTELVTALNMNYIELPSFGVVPLNSPDNLRETFWRCVEADKLFGTDED
jgi:hypothetical protein